MSLFRRERAIEVEALSGTLRITVAPKPAWMFLLVEGGGILIFSFIASRFWALIPLWNRALLLWGEAGAVVAWFSQLSGSEVVELNEQGLSISKNILGWTRTSEYPLSLCRELEWRKGNGGGDSSGLQCKAGWRTLKFGKYISEDEASEIFSSLRENLPEVVTQLCAMPNGRKQFTTLNLS